MSSGKPEPGELGNATTVVPASDPRTGPLAPKTSIFVPGDLVAGRYRVTRFIAFGGMGEVYEVEDTVLKEKLALKTIRADAAEDARIRERFKREIALARKVTHVNVCRIFDLGFHLLEGREQMFLTMELLAGETLSQRVRLGRPFTVAEAEPVVEQMVAALDAAHREGIVHRDFKSGNVMLVPDAGKPGGFRAVVTDFGLARGVEGDDPFATAPAGTVGLMGSPAYMAPEQVDGGEVGLQADIYALGVVMFEMLTGRVPFLGETAVSVAVKRIKEPAPSPRVHVPDLPEVWERTILRCLERVPGHRFARVADVLGSLAGKLPAPRPEPGTEPEPARRSRRSRRSRRWMWLAMAAAAAIAVGAGGGWLLSRHRPAPAGAAAAATRATMGLRPAIAVLGFKNLSGREDVAWLATALGEMLTTELATGGELRTLPGESIARMKRELRLEDADSFAPDTLARIQKNLGADFVVVGAFAPLGDKLRLDVRLQNVASGETIAQIADTGTEAELAGLVSRTGAKLREHLRVRQAPASEVAIVNTTLPRNPEAARLFAEGLAKSRLYAMTAARGLLERSIAIEPEFAPAHAVLSEALAYLGHDVDALQEAKKAFDLSGDLPREERLRVEGHYWSRTGDHTRSVGVYRQLYQAAPDNLEYGMYLAAELFAAGDDTEALNQVERLRKMPNASDDPRLYMVEMGAAYVRQDYPEVLRAMDKLSRSGEEKGALSLIGEARHMSAYAEWFEGELEKSIASADEARRISAALGDRDGESDALNQKAFVLTEVGGYAEARKLAQQAIDIDKELGSRRHLWVSYHVLARCGLFGGDLDAAYRLYDTSRQSSAEIGSAYGESLAYLGMAVVSTVRGELAKARPMFERVLLGARIFVPKHNTAIILHYLGDLDFAAGQLADARKSYDAALAQHEQIGEHLEVARDKLSLAALDLEEGRAAEAEKRAREVLPAIHGWKLANDEVHADCLLARALVAQGKHEPAEKLVADAASLAASSENQMVKLEVALAQGVVLGASTDATLRAQATKALEAGVADATRMQYVGHSLALRLALARLESQAGKRVDDLVAGIRRDAEAKGYALTVKKATALSRP
jgi:eukaryotic-like serine/threonine-protein kinase